MENGEWRMENGEWRMENHFGCASYEKGILAARCLIKLQNDEVSDTRDDDSSNANGCIKIKILLIHS